MAIFYPQKITTTSKTEVTFAYNNYSSMTFTNSHASSAITIDLYAASQVGTDITATDVYAAETEAASTSSVTLTVDNGSGSASDAANDEFLNERVYKADGNLYGICTTVTSTTVLVFSGGLERQIRDDDILQVGARHHFLNNVKIPNGASLKLTADEFRFDDTNYKLYIRADVAGIDIITRY